MLSLVHLAGLEYWYLLRSAALTHKTAGNLRRVSDMLRSASSARADVSESFSSALTEALPRPSVDYSALSSRNTSVAVPPSPLGR